MKNENIEKEIHITFIGKSKVGKTSIFHRFWNEEFNEKVESTGTVEKYKIKIFSYKDKNYQIYVTDTPGSEKEDLEQIISEYCRFSQGFFLIFDLTNRNSLDNINFWIDKILKINSNNKFIILGNKCDAKKIMSEEFIKDKFQYGLNNIKYLVTSAKTGKNIKQAFKAMIDLIEGNELSEDKCCKCC